MKTIALIPARYASTRLPAKPLLEVLGKPLIQHVYENISKMQGLDEVIIATDDERIVKAVENFDGQVMMTGNQHQTGTDRIAELASNIKGDIILNVQGDEPDLMEASIQQCLKPFKEDSSCRMTTLKHKIADPQEIQNPNVVKVITDQNNDAIYFSRQALPYNRSNQNLTHYKHIGIYAYQRDFLLQISKLPQTPLEKAESLEQLRVLENGFKIKVNETEFVTSGIDTPEDFEAFKNKMETQS